MNQKKEREKTVFFIRSATHGSRRVTAREGRGREGMAHQGHFCIASSIKAQRSSARMKERLTLFALPTETRLMIGEIGTRPLFPRNRKFFFSLPA